MGGIVPQRKIKLVLADGSTYPYLYKIYVCAYESLHPGTDLKDMWRVLVYLQDKHPDMDIQLQYDQAQARGTGIINVTEFNQGALETVMPVSVIPEAPQGAPDRSWTLSDQPIVSTAGVQSIVRVYFEGHTKVSVSVPVVADNYLPWFPEIQKGSFGWEVSLEDVLSNMPPGSISGNMYQFILNILLRNLNVQYAALHPGQSIPAGSYSDVKIRFNYSTEEYVRKYQGHSYASSWDFARSRPGIIDGDSVVLSHDGINPGLPIIIVVKETFADDQDKVWVVTNMEDNDATTFLWEHSHVLDHASPIFLPVLYVDGNRVFFDDLIDTISSATGKSQRVHKEFGPFIDIVSFYFYRNDTIQYTGYTDGTHFHYCDVNPSLGHGFSGYIRKELKYNQFRGVWESGVRDVISLPAPALYDMDTGVLIPLNKWDPTTHSQTQLDLGEFDIDPTAWADQDPTAHTVLLVCKALGIPGYNLFSTRLYLRMIPTSVTMDFVDGNDYYTINVPHSTNSDRIMYGTALDNTNPEMNRDEILIAGVQIIPNTMYGQNMIFDTRSLGGGLREDLAPQGPELHFWDIGYMDGQPYTGNMALVIEVPVSIKRMFHEAGKTDTEIDDFFRERLTHFVAKGSLVMIQYV